MLVTAHTDCEVIWTADMTWDVSRDNLKTRTVWAVLDRLCLTSVWQNLNINFTHTHTDGKSHNLIASWWTNISWNLWKTRSQGGPYLPACTCISQPEIGRPTTLWAKAAKSTIQNTGLAPSQGGVTLQLSSTSKLWSDADFVLQVKCTIFWLNRGLSVYLVLYAPNFPKKYF